MKMILNRHLGHSTLACGMENNDDDCRRMLFEWADAVVILHRDFESGVMPEFRHKMHVFDVGDDVWGNPFDPDLQMKIVEMLNTNPVLNFGRVINGEKVLQKLNAYREKIEARLEPAAV